MGYPAKHCEPILLGQAKGLRHPWEIVCKTEMSPPNAFWYSLTSTCETQGRDTVRANHDAWGVCFLIGLVLKDIVDRMTFQSSVALDRQGRHKCLEGQLIRDELFHLRGNVASFFDDKQSCRLRDAEVDGLSSGWISGVCDVKACSTEGVIYL